MAGAAARAALPSGSWRHVDLSANGLRFHLALGEHFTTTAPLVLLLHGFVQSWWAWRGQLPALDRAGHAVAALDLRGAGASDQPPSGYDPVSTAGDISGVIRSLGFPTAVLVGHDLGARAAWATTAYAPAQVSALAVVGAGHPRHDRSASLVLPRHGLPVLAERRLAADDGAWAEAYLQGLTARPDALAKADTEPYRAALRDWPGPRCALAPVRIVRRGQRSAANRDLFARLEPGTDVPVLVVRGASDPVLPSGSVKPISRYAHGRFDATELGGVGHLAPEEDPLGFNQVLLDWLNTQPCSA